MHITDIYRLLQIQYALYIRKDRSIEMDKTTFHIGLKQEIQKILYYHNIYMPPISN